MLTGCLQMSSDADVARLLDLDSSTCLLLDSTNVSAVTTFSSFNDSFSCRTTGSDVMMLTVSLATGTSCASLKKLFYTSASESDGCGTNSFRSCTLVSAVSDVGECSVRCRCPNSACDGVINVLPQPYAAFETLEICDIAVV